MRVTSAGDGDVHAFRDQRASDREPDSTRSTGDDRDLTSKFLFHGCHYNSARMEEVAIVGAGELGGAIALLLARTDMAARIRLIDAAGQVAAGKALDIMQAAPIEQFATTVSGYPDITRAAGAQVIVLADRAGGAEWQGEEGLLLLTQLSQLASRSVVVCAG